MRHYNVMRAWLTRSELPIPIRWLVLAVAAAAFVAGLYGRFKGIGLWPLGVDEFYISRSIDHVIQWGVPRFSCGGYYTRGLLYQYVVAGLRLLGLTPEFAGRMVAALSSLAVLPAAYRLGKRLEGPLAGWLMVIMLCVSVWEIEMARFARMYAPFQAVFAWYMVLFLRYTVDRDRTALRWMIALSILGVLTWEGGALIGLANLLAILLMHEQGRLKGKDWLQLAGLTVLLGVLVASTRDLRGSVAMPGQAAGAAGLASGRLHLLAAWFAPLRTIRHGLSDCSCRSASRRPRRLDGLPPAPAARARRTMCRRSRRPRCIFSPRRRRHRPPAPHGTHRLARSRRSARTLVHCGARCLPGVLAGGVSLARRIVPAHAGERCRHRHASRASASVRIPAVYDEFVRPWGRTLPILSALLALALASWSEPRSPPRGMPTAPPGVY